ncbi:MAG: hypothetical protein AAGI53_03810 [Planctomycetota bacterium]
MSDAHGHDDWFRHSGDEALPQVEHAGHVSTKALGISLVLIVFGVLFVLLLLTAYFNSYVTQKKADLEESTTAAAGYMQYRSESTGHLNETGWIDRDNEKLHIPLDRAIEFVVEDYRAAAPVSGQTDFASTD